MPIFGSKANTISGSTDTRQAFEVVVMPALSGKSKLQGELAKYQGEKRTVCFDADALATSLIAADPTLQALDTPANAAMLEAIMCKKLQESLLQYLTTLPDVAVLCVTSNTAFVDFLGVKDKRIHIYIPSPDLFATMYREISTTSGQESADMLLKSKERIMAWGHDKSIVVYTCLADIVKDLAAKLGLTLSAY